MDSFGQPAKSPRNLSRPVKWVISLLVLALFALVLFVFLIGPTMLEKYDSAHRTTISCEMTAAYAGSASSRSLRGVGTSSNQVEYRSTDCGTLVMSGGLTTEAAEEKAAEIVRGGRYEVKIGAGSARLRGLFQGIGVAPNVFDVRAETDR
ncbi:hypothetical protein [Curtobacterium sp. MCPF17_001]|uniref:hypothetical protein n=1 Tax=Curtobacterium sp. MCPF17_001 TaxID=2175651 RepID=UPI0011B7C96F|nr:hypothetical protein [Curtobacterium sp. MCPF17_001]